MGCDFYEKLYLVIEYFTLEGKIVTEEELLSKTPHWFCGNCDSDSEDASDRALDQEMSRIEKSHGQKIVYDKDEWKITSSYKRDHYNNISLKYMPEGSNILRIYKYISCEQRY